MSEATDMAELGALTYRDSMKWSAVEAQRGVYNFNTPFTNYLDGVQAAGLSPTVLFASTNPLYDSNGTPYSATGVAAFAKFVDATLDRFPDVEAVEIGNEFNGQNFVYGKVKYDGWDKRPEYQVNMLKAVYTALQGEHADTKILGAAAHSFSLGYLEDLFKLGALNYMDGIAIHPYTTPPELMENHMEMLRELIAQYLPAGKAAPEIHFTEFGQSGLSPAANADYLVKMVAASSGAGVDQMEWFRYRVTDWFPGMGLVDGDVRMPAANGFELMAERVLALGDGVRIASANSTYVYDFEDGAADALVMWGQGETVRFSGAVQLYSSDGTRIYGSTIALDPDRPVIAVGDFEYTLGGSNVLASSYDDFLEEDTPWSYFGRDTRTGQTASFTVRQGADIAGERWTPFLAHDWRKPMSISETTVNPARFGSTDHAIVEQYTATKSASVDIAADWNVSDYTKNGVHVSITHSGEVLYDARFTNTASVSLANIVVAAGDTIEFSVDPNGEATKDMTVRHYRIVEADAARMGTPLDGQNQSAGRSAIAGDERSDSIEGGSGTDTLRGAAGSDLLVGGADRDVLVGGSEADVFALEQGAQIDFVRDFSPGGGDKLDLSAFGLEGIDDPDLAIWSTEVRTVVAIGEDQFRLAGVIAINAGDLIF